MSNRRPEGNTPLESSLDKAARHSEASMIQQFDKLVGNAEARISEAKADARIAELEAENAKLRSIMSSVATNIGNGSFASEKCSLEFFETVANEVGAETKYLRARAQSAEADAAALRVALDTVLGCLDAAEVEGWSEAICNIHEDWARERIVDVWTRRISCIREEAEAALNTNAGKALLERIAELEGLLRECCDALMGNRSIETPLVQRIEAVLEAK